MASDAYRGARSFAEHCRLQGLDRPVTLPGWSRDAKFRAVGNGVPLPMGRVLAAAVLAASPRDSAGTDCVCGCGRRVTPPAIQATAACRKRMERRRRGTRSVVTPDGLRPGRRCVVTPEGVTQPD
jgi:DNA (cytosine-5)-methyltransferase 1